MGLRVPRVLQVPLALPELQVRLVRLGLALLVLRAFRVDGQLNTVGPPMSLVSDPGSGTIKCDSGETLFQLARLAPWVMLLHCWLCWMILRTL